MIRYALALALLAPAAAVAQPAPAVDAERVAGLGSFVDGVAAHAIATREVAGAVVTVVYKGRVLWSRGYGFADVERGVPIDGARTLFRPGSVSKLFTWTALMQQVEAGRVGPMPTSTLTSTSASRRSRAGRSASAISCRTAPA